MAILSLISVVIVTALLVGRSTSSGCDWSKKGIQLKLEFTDDALDLGVDWGFVNFSTAWMIDVPTPYSIDYNGKTYYFSEPVIMEYDRMLDIMAENDIKVVASFLNQWNDYYPCMRYPGTETSEATMYYAFNTENEEGRECARAFAEFFVRRYGPEGNGSICGWLVGNEVNDNLQYHYMNPCGMQEYVSAYYDEFRLFYDVIKAHDAEADVYIPLEHRWQTANTMTDYGGRWFLEYFHELELERGEMDWGLAWHPYPYPLGDPDTLDDGDYPTTDTDGLPSYGGEVTLDYTTPIISMKNLDILTDYFTENLLNPDGTVRPIILSEVGYTSYSVICGENEAKQAANIAYAYYKAEANPYIQAIIIRSHQDEDEGSPYFQFGLRRANDDQIKKLSYEVFKALGSVQGCSYDDMLLAVLGADRWEDIIPGYVKPGSGISGWLASRENNTSSENSSGKRDISSCTVGTIADQIYTGLPVLPEIEVYDGVKLLEEAKDYDLSYTSNLKPGTAQIVVVGRGDYTGFKVFSFEITGAFADILNPSWYFANCPEAEAACDSDPAKAEEYFLNTGLPRGDRGCEEFDVRYYLNNYPDLQAKYGTDLVSAAGHYISEGKAAGFVGSHMLSSTTYMGYDYAFVYDPSYIEWRYPDIFTQCGGDPLSLLEYFVTTGMDEGMQGAEWFNPEVYRDLNPDVSEHFGNDIKSLYLHFCTNGYKEGRTACLYTFENNTDTVFFGNDYSQVFNAEYYMSGYEDVRAYVSERTGEGSGISEGQAALEHFVLWGMKEGRKGSAQFDPLMYKALYSDVREAYGDLYEMYYLHYMRNGKAEGRFTSVTVL